MPWIVSGDRARSARVCAPASPSAHRFALSTGRLGSGFRRLVGAAGLAALFLGPGSAAAAPDLGDSAPPIVDSKPMRIPVDRVAVKFEGGERVADAVPFPSIPGVATGSTCGRRNDYDSSCPYPGSKSPDVVYRLTSPVPIRVDVSLCNSDFDTKLYVFESAPGFLVGCNDDAGCGTGLQSELPGLELSPGVEYYVVVDGYGVDCGQYELAITESPQVECAAGAFVENEPVCGPNYVDETNAGCNGEFGIPPRFTNLPCSADGQPVEFCGEYGGYTAFGEDRRDTDWIRIAADGNYDGATWCVTGTYATQAGYLTPVPCDEADAFDEWAILEPFETACFDIPPGEVWLWVGTVDSGAAAGACGGGYVMSVDGYGCETVSTTERSWGEVKARYRP